MIFFIRTFLELKIATQHHPLSLFNFLPPETQRQIHLALGYRKKEILSLLPSPWWHSTVLREGTATTAVLVPVRPCKKGPFGYVEPQRQRTS
jgi:hypothetical protein